MTPRALGVAPPPRRRVVVATLLMVSVAALALGIADAAERHEAIRLGYELARATGERQALQEENRRLRVERSLLRNPGRIEHQARLLGMARPEPHRIRVVREARTHLAGHDPTQGR
jgi:cell division protein FtsL